MKTNPSYPPRRYRGIYWYSAWPSWQVRFAYKDKRIMLGYFKDDEVAACVSDFAKYLMFGLNPAMWTRDCAKPNFPPRNTPNYPRCLILKKLADSCILSIDELQKRLAAFDAVAI